MTEHDNGILIAYLTEVRGDGMDARIAEDYSTELPVIQVGDEEILVGHIGSYVVIRQSDIGVLALVFKMWEKDRFNTQGERLSDRFISLIPVGELQNEQFIRGVRHYPTPGAKVYAVGLNEINAIFSAFRDYQFYIGQLAAHKDYHLSLDPRALFGRHFAIIGQSGSGKSWTVTSLIQHTIKAMPKCHMIMLDLHGEYCWKRDDGSIQSAFADDTVNYVDALELEMPYWMMTYAELVDLFIDKQDRGASMQMAFMREILQQLKRKEAKKIGLTGVSIDTPIYFSLAEMYMQFKNANEERKDFGKTKGALFGQFDEFLVRMQSRFNDVRYDFLLKPKKRNTSDSMADLLREFIGLGQKKANITVVDLSSVPTDVRPAVSAQVGRLAYEFNYWNPRRREFPITLICEEAHAYIPREKGGQFDGTKRMMERIAKEGRKYGVSIGVISQRPTELSETMLSQCSTFICLRTTNPDDQQYIRGLVPEAEGDLTDILTSLGRGEALVLGEAAPLPTRVQIYRPDPPPKSNDVDYYTSWREGAEELDVEGIVNNWRTQTRQ
ncbi:ATP-binding protein [methane-oxidizing endosymbiont of Gigantopelta aegis]|uniref:ATP-binding protein n=1 Tax=methane-oxidizing endosymbiont of Gigantopelta aegis TaxID=2794938 RepID=UPI0018DB9F94|nr:ATP-binding protein [methane-oxidizing endosymbiont of Gigantopelta aegis]